MSVSCWSLEIQQEKEEVFSQDYFGIVVWKPADEVEVSVFFTQINVQWTGMTD